MRGSANARGDVMSTVRWWRLVALLVVAGVVLPVLWELVLAGLGISVPHEYAWVLRGRAVVTATILAALAAWYLTRVGRAYGALVEVRRVESQLDCAPVTVVRLDRAGTITHVNEAWRRFARDNGADERTIAGVGLGYLDALRGADAAEREPVVAGVGDVLFGRRPSFEWGYACHAPGELRWFAAEARAVDDDAVVIVHTDVTAARLAAGRERAQATLAQAMVLRSPLPEAAAAFARALSVELE